MAPLARRASNRGKGRGSVGDHMLGLQHIPRVHLQLKTPSWEVRGETHLLSEALGNCSQPELVMLNLKAQWSCFSRRHLPVLGASGRADGWYDGHLQVQCGKCWERP